MASGYAAGSRSQLPGWARGGLAGLGKAGVSGILHRDPLPSTRLSPLSAVGQRMHSRDSVERGGGEEKRRRIEHLERNIMFLRQQHKETLQHLHSETERLKKENRELSFQLIMCHCDHTSSHPQQNPEEVLLQEVQQLRQALAEERCKNGRILQLLQRESSVSLMPGHEEEEVRGCQATSGLVRKEEKIHKNQAFIPLSIAVKQTTEDQSGLQQLQDNLKLPELKPHLLGGVAERQRRRRALQKRLSRASLPLLHHD